MSSVGKPLVVQVDGTSIAPANLNPTHLVPGTNGQAIVTTGGATAWGSVAVGPSNITPGTSQQVLMTNGGVASWQSKKWSYAFGELVVSAASNANANTDLTIPLDVGPTAISASTGVGGIGSTAFNQVNSTTISATYAGVYAFRCNLTFTNTSNNSGQYTNISVYQDGLPVAGIGRTSPQVALKDCAYNGMTYVALNANSNVTFRCKGSAQLGSPITGDMNIGGKIFYQLMNTL